MELDVTPDQGDEEAGPPAGARRPRPDHRAEALRANLKRRKAQTRARDHARPDGPQAVPEPGAPGDDG